MSIDYFLFLDCEAPVEVVLNELSHVNGVLFDPALEELQIKGLTPVGYACMDDRHIETMQVCYGDFGINVNWYVMGTYDKVTDIEEVTDRLLHCAAAIVNAYPDMTLALMWQGQHFYVRNTSESLMIVPFFEEEAVPLFKKPCEINWMRD